jgi:ribonucleoside-triphosphate reductase
MSFKLTENFLDSYRHRKPPFGFNGLGDLVYRRTYSRLKPSGSKEQWWETCRRVTEGVYTMQQEHIDRYGLGWDSRQAQRSAQEFYTRMWEMKFLPPGRGLWAMGSEIITERKLYAALNNCAMVSTEDLKDDFAKPFVFLMDMSMLGVGVGFDTKGAGSVVLKNPQQETEDFVIPDSRDGWTEALRKLLESFFKGSKTVRFDWSQIRKAGEPIKGFGGTASGPAPLRDGLEAIRQTCDKYTGKAVDSRFIVDVMNLIGRIVVSGNVRRSAEIALGEANDFNFIRLKDYNEFPERQSFGWASNNSIIFNSNGGRYDIYTNNILVNGEPGIFWLDNARNFGRMGESRPDLRVMGQNPCGEQSLESYELCCLVETFPARHTDREDFLRTLKYAYLYAKTVTLGQTHWPETNRVMLRNRRIGCSVSGVQQFCASRGIGDLKVWLSNGYDVIQNWDKIYSDWFCIPRSIKTTSVKPSGTVSLLAGATPGIHWPESRFYIRRIRLSKESELLPGLRKAGYPVESDIADTSAVVVEFPVDCGEGVKPVSEVSIWQQLEMVAFMQKYWADNQVSCTVSFDPEREGRDIAPALELYQYRLKSVSFLPRKPGGAYKQSPYEAIDEREYNQRMEEIESKVSFGKLHEEAEPERFCDGDSCTL